MLLKIISNRLNKKVLCSTHEKTQQAHKNYNRGWKNWLVDKSYNYDFDHNGPVQSKKGPTTRPRTDPQIDPKWSPVKKPFRINITYGIGEHFGLQYWASKLVCPNGNTGIKISLCKTTTTEHFLIGDNWILFYVLIDNLSNNFLSRFP